MHGLSYPFDELLKASRPIFRSARHKVQAKYQGCTTICDIDIYKEDVWTVSDLQSRGILYFQITQGSKTIPDGFTDKEHTVLWALLLEPTNQMKTTYRRTGIAEISHK